VLEAVTGAGDADLGESLVEMTKAKVQAKASIAVIRFSDEMWDALVAIGNEPQR
jgi:hypothetical protein